MLRPELSFVKVNKKAGAPCGMDKSMRLLCLAPADRNHLFNLEDPVYQISYKYYPNKLEISYKL